MSYLLVYDLDGCLYNYSTLPDYGFYKLCDEANALAAQAIFPELGYEGALALAAQSFRDYHDCYGAFLAYGETNGAEATQVRSRLFKDYHKILFALLEERYPNFFDHTAATAEAFLQVSQGPFTNALLSHSCMEGWGRPVLKKIGILDYFEPHLIWGMDDYSFERKFESAVPMRKLIAASGFSAEQIIFVEDSWRNTQPAFEQLGVKVALIHYEAAPPAYDTKGVHWVSATPAELLQTLQRQFGLSPLTPIKTYLPRQLLG